MAIAGRCAMIEAMKPAEPSDWKTKPLPKKRVVIPLDRFFSAAEMLKIRLGLRPEQMEDKWFIYWKDEALFFHRSWTGICMYVLRFKAEGDSARLIQAEVNRDPEQYLNVDDQYDVDLIYYLIDVLLLNRAADFPVNPASRLEGTLQNWSSVGRAMLSKGPRRKK
jgi:hypothetical protein